MEDERANLPAQIADALVSVSKGLTPSVFKALDRLLGAAADVPAAWLAQKKAKIDAQTESYKLVEASIAQAAAVGAGADLDTAQRAMNVLVRKEYRKQTNREAVAAAMVEDMREHASEAADGASSPPAAELDEDWLNLFERYVEDASSDRLQGLWGRVLAGEIRKPGRFSARTLRFLSEFSQADALSFEVFAKNAFGDAAPKKLVMPSDKEDIRHLINLEASGLIQGVSGTGLHRIMTFNENGNVFILENEIVICLKGDPGSVVRQGIVALTPLGQELLSLIRSRKPRESAKAFALAFRVPETHECYLGVREDTSGRVQLTEVLWVRESAEEPIVQGEAHKRRG